jgi:asparagine synthase (glutamine-hydrolysing)
MCGLAGVITGDEQAVRAALPRMVEAQAHRGPDDSGQAVFPFGHLCFGLGHRRLSILDLTSAAHQPMIHRDSGDVLIFNGQIYNFRRLRAMLENEGFSFSSTGDTEVLLKALVHWGPLALEKLEGMFALAFLDRSAGTLLLARDPVGIKPLYLACSPGLLVFASEVRGVLASGLVSRDIDRAGLAGYLAYGSLQAPLTLFKNVRSFPAGSWMGISPSAITTGALPEARNHWVFPRPDAGVSSAVAAGRIRDTLQVAVSDHLMSDVPLGFYLSSGVDSTIVTSLAARGNANVHTFTVGFPADNQLNEVAAARKTADSLGARHTEVILTESGAQRSTLRWLETLDSPSMDGLNTFVVSEAAKHVGITVAIAGQGGDELFGGYPSFSDVPRFRRVLKHLTWMPGRIRAWATGIVLARESEAVRLKAHDMAGSPTGLLPLYLQRRRTLADRQMAMLGFDSIALGLSDGYLPREAARRLSTDESDPVWTISQYETRLYLGNMLLRDGDATGMAHGIEIRVPMLDRRVLDLVCALPGRIRLPTGKADKHLLKVACGDLLRDDVIAGEKRGFVLPLWRWMLGPLRELCEDSLKSLRASGLVHLPGVEAVWQAFLREPESPIWSRAWELCVAGYYLAAPRTSASSRHEA